MRQKCDDIAMRKYEFLSVQEEFFVYLYNKLGNIIISTQNLPRNMTDKTCIHISVIF